MRVWEFEDNKAIPSDLVREQDFILRVRRLQRIGTSHLVINLVLNAHENIVKSHRTLEAVQKRLQEFSKITNGTYIEMSNGDVFIIWEETEDAQLLATRLVSVLMPDEKEAIDTSRFLLTYHLPRDYTLLRERANHYVEVVRTLTSLATDGAPAARALKSEAARGPLTAWTVDQISKLLTEIDVRRYGRTQSIYQYQVDGTWKPLSEEYFVSFDDLRRECFPKLDIITPEHLFFSLCQTLDHELLTSLTEHHDIIADRAINLNLAVNSILGGVFARFAHTVPHGKRSLVCFELHRGDLFQDFTMTLNAISVLRHEGFKVAIDGVTPRMLSYVNFGLFNADYIKLNVSKDRAEQLADPVVQQSLKLIPPDQMVFFRCDNDAALKTGLELGVSKFQGWLIDDAVSRKS